MSPDRYTEMEAVRLSSKAEYANLLQHTLHSPSDPAYFDILHSRLEECLLLRAYFTVLMRQYVSAGIREKPILDTLITDIKFPFVSEALMAVMYYDNQVFDKKGGVLTTEAASANIKKGKRLYDAILRYLNKTVTDRRACEKLNELVTEVHTAVLAGQEMESRCNRYENWISGKISYLKDSNIPESDIRPFVIAKVRETIQNRFQFPEAKLPYIDAYLERIYWANAYFFERICAFIIDYCDPTHPEKEPLLKFAALFGMMIQIVNDNSDFVPSGAREESPTKNCCDALSDLRNRNITLPLAIHLVNCPEGAVARYLANDSGAESWDEEDFSDEIIKHSLFNSIRIASKIKTICMELLLGDNPTYKLLEDMATISERNKFYFYYFPRRRKLRKSKKPDSELDQNSEFV